MNRDKRTQIFERLKANDPAPTTELEYGTPFELLISVILSAQATDVSVNKATRELSRWPERRSRSSISVWPD
jgi:endonuclease-3